MRRRQAIWIGVALALCVAATACGGGGNPLIISELFAVFSADPRTSPDPRISMEPGSTSAAVFNVEVHVSGVADLYGAAFTVVYNPATAIFKSCDAEGSVLVAGGAPTNPCDNTLVGGAKFVAGLQNGNEGLLNVGASLDGLVPGIPAGTGLLLTLTFEAIDATGGPESFSFEVGPSREVERCPQDLSPCSSVNTGFDGGMLVASFG